MELEAAETGYKARNAGTSAIHDITVYRPVGDGKFRAAYVATIPGAAKPAAAPDTTTPPMPVAAPAVKPAPGLAVAAIQAIVGTPVPAPALLRRIQCQRLHLLQRLHSMTSIGSATLKHRINWWPPGNHCWLLRGWAQQRSLTCSRS